MSRALTVVLLVVVGCSSATADTTSTVGGQAATVTTSAVVPVTTSTAPTTSTDDPDGCPPGGGGQTSRGFQCPPDLPQLDRSATVVTFQMLPGTYRTRTFKPLLEFTNPNRFIIQGETDFFVDLDLQSMQLFLGRTLISDEQVVEPLRAADLLSHECAEDPVSGEATIGGFHAETTTVTLTCDIRVLIPNDPLQYILFADNRILQYYVELPDSTLLIQVEADADLFDSYLAERAQPILDSIVFLDQ